MCDHCHSLVDFFWVRKVLGRDHVGRVNFQVVKAKEIRKDDGTKRSESRCDKRDVVYMDDDRKKKAAKIGTTEETAGEKVSDQLDATG